MAVTLNSMGLDPDKINYLLIGMVATYLPMCLLYLKFFSHIPRKLLMVIATFGNGASMFFLGPSKLLKLP